MNARLIPFLIAAVVFVLDRVTKWRIREQVGAFDIHPVIPGFFNIVHTENAGAAFSLLADATGVWRSIFLIGLSAGVAIFIAIALIRPGGSPLVRTALSLVLGGASGNLFDRVATGTVTDFLEFYWRQCYFPAFNVADSGITAGAALLLIDLFFSRRAQESKKNKLEPHVS